MAGCAANVYIRVSAEDVNALNLRNAPWINPLNSGERSVLKHFNVTGKKPRPFVWLQGERSPATATNSQSSASMLRQVMRVESADVSMVMFS